MLGTMDSQQPASLLRVACPLQDGSHSSDALSEAMRRGKMLRLRRGVYVPAEVWLRSHPSERYRLAVAAESLQNPNVVFCRESALSIHGLPLLAVPRQIHLRVASRGSVRTSRQTPLTGSVSKAEFLRRARLAGVIDETEVPPYALRGFDTARHLDSGGLTQSEKQGLALPTPAAGSEVQENLVVNVEPLALSLVDTAVRLPFAGAVVLLDAALHGAPARAPLDAAQLGEIADVQLSARRRQYLKRLLHFASPLSESPGESLARVRFHELGFAPPQLQVTLQVHNKAYRLDFCWEAVGVVVEFDGWLKYRMENSTFDEVYKQEKIREDAIRSTRRTVVRIYWEDLMEPHCRRLIELLTRAGVPRMA